ncbi:MBL fold metallo-hydrolase [Crocinitomix catalasitica]|uniref:MBL fold metallo-hydrolase n=1 Tax=Crocinitomix catalasitica TaxID=184607 RepID=UPI000487BDB8|nr:MBL fold metallo-hydrolase [Crocinitomix catalasitica]
MLNKILSMIQVHKFTFNPFQENTYILSDESKDCVIVDPGCFDKSEQNTLSKFIEDNGLNPVKLINTHCHIDHVLGNNFVNKKYNLPLGIHKLDLPTLSFMGQSASLYGFQGYELSPDPEYFFDEGDIIKFGNSELSVIFGPGHAPGHVAFYSKADNILINGDILFKGSYGRYDLPGGSFEVLKKTITEKLFLLPDETVVYCGHGPETTIGEEKKSNMILMG